MCSRAGKGLMDELCSYRKLIFECFIESQEHSVAVDARDLWRSPSLKTRKNFFPLRVTEPWARLPRGAVESPSLEMFTPHLDVVLCSLLWVTLLRQGGWTG